MNKNDLVSAVATQAGLSKADATKAVDGVFDSITGALRGGGEVRVVGFGTFSVANRTPSTSPARPEDFRMPVAVPQPAFAFPGQNSAFPCDRVFPAHIFDCI